MLECEGYKMFFGSAQILPVNREPFVVRGTWLYKPQYDTWYCSGRSYPACIVGEITEER